MVLRKALWRQGGRFRLHAADVPGRPDIVFPKAMVVVFCDGDFWHGRDWLHRRAQLMKGSNARYWVDKIAANRRRDRVHNRALRELGWCVIRLWEAEIIHEPEQAALRVLALVRARLESVGARSRGCKRTVW